MEVALNPESKRKTAMAVAFRDGERSFGGDAMQVAVKYPKNCYFYLLDLLGKKIDHPAVKLFLQRFPYYDIEADAERGNVVFRHDEETTYSVEELVNKLVENLITIWYSEDPINRQSSFQMVDTNLLVCIVC